MDNDFVATLIPMTVIAIGIDWCGGFHMFNLISTFLSQNGF